MSYTAKVTASNNFPVKFRSSPSSANDSNVIAKIPLGETVEVIEDGDNGWSQISYNGTNGYMMTKFLASSNNGAVVSLNDLQIIYNSLSKTLQIIDEILNK